MKNDLEMMKTSDDFDGTKNYIEYLRSECERMKALLQPCGHPMSAIVGQPCGDGDFTLFCGMCADEARLHGVVTGTGI